MEKVIIAMYLINAAASVLFTAAVNFSGNAPQMELFFCPYLCGAIAEVVYKS